MKLLLISLQSNDSLIGLKYIAANVRSSGYDVRILHIPGYLESALDPAIESFVGEYAPDSQGRAEGGHSAISRSNKA